MTPIPSAVPGLPASRDQVLAAVLHPSRLPTPPAVALQVVQVASRPDCSPKEVVAVLGRDPALCGKLLKTVNSCLYGLARPVASLERAVLVLGLNGLRSLALSLSLPAVRVSGGNDREFRDYWVSSVGGGIIARELAARAGVGSGEDDLVAGLLRDLGAVLLRRTYPDEWRAAAAADPDRWLTCPDEVEEEAFGVSHPDVSAELLRLWNLPPEIVEPIRWHHAVVKSDQVPEPYVARTEVLYLAGLLTQIDEVAQRPQLLARVFRLAWERFRLTRDGLIAFLEGVVPKVREFARLIDQDIGRGEDFAGVLAAGCEELASLAVENSLSRLSAEARASHTHPRAGTATLVSRPGWSPPPAEPAGPPEFRPEFLDHWPDGGCRLDAFELRSLLGRGAMGVVFRAYEPSLDREVAVKVLAPELAAWPQARHRFAREARVSAAIRHPNVVAIHAVRETGGFPYLAMELVDGGTLQERLDAGMVPPAEILKLARQVAAGLAAAHEQDIVHRDMKPANVLLDTRTGQAKISDFGLARAAGDAALSRDGTMIGTPLYMSPEQVCGKPATPRSDLFALGALVYAVATGQSPFAGEHVAAVLRAVAEEEPAPLREVRPDLPELLEGVVMRLLRKDPAHRYASAMQVVAALGAIK